MSQASEGSEQRKRAASSTDVKPVADVNESDAALQPPPLDAEEVNIDAEEDEKPAEPLATLVDEKDDSIIPLGRDQILASKKDAGRIYKVRAFFIDAEQKVRGWVFFKAFTPNQRDAFENSLVVGKGRKAKVSTKNIRAKMFVSCVCGAKGQRLFRDEDYAIVGQLPGPEVERVFQAMQEINSFSDEDIEELAGNSDAGRSGSGQQ